MGDAILVGKMQPKTIKSLQEEYQEAKAQYRQDVQNRELKRVGQLTKSATPAELSCERFPEET